MCHTSDIYSQISISGTLYMRDFAVCGTFVDARFLRFAPYSNSVWGISPYAGDFFLFFYPPAYRDPTVIRKLLSTEINPHIIS